jgi:carbamoylphosphate synthase large subunit
MKPLTTESIEEILKKHMIDAVLPTMGAQTALLFELNRAQLDRRRTGVTA